MRDLRRLTPAALLAAAASLVVPASALAQQLRAQVVVSGLTAPVAFVQDPSNPTVQYIVQQGGLIRVLQNGVLLPTPFLNLTSAVLSGGERGLLGLAFPPDYGTSGRFYVNFTRAGDGHTVVARFERSATNPLVANPLSRFDLRWSAGERFIRQPAPNHNGGNMAFGPDGYLYIGMGDGGSGNDPSHFAQNPASLLGKMLRIDVDVPPDDPEGFVIPTDNPFASGPAPEIWAFGLRNPWRFSFDDPDRGGTGALIIGDVGQARFEEINYEPLGSGGRNYGWRNREGAHDNVTTLPPAFMPLTDPIFEYSHAVGGSVTGGFVYRGTALGSGFRGRYFFADFVAGRVWSLALIVGAGGEATAADLREHTAELSAPTPLGTISSFGVDAAGELYIVSYSGRILRIARRPPIPRLHIDIPGNGARIRQPFVIAGWALDATSAFDSGIDVIDVWAAPASGALSRYAGPAFRVARPDVAAAFGPQFAQAGFGRVVTGLLPGAYRLKAFGRLTATGRFDALATVDVVIEGGGLLAVDAPLPFSTVGRTFLIGGWAADPSSPTGTGVDVLHVWAYPVAPATGSPIFLGVPSYGGIRPDVAAFLGNTRFRPTGYNLVVSSLPPGTWDIVVYARSTVTRMFDTARLVRVTIR